MSETRLFKEGPMDQRCTCDNPAACPRIIEQAQRVCDDAARRRWAKDLAKG